MIRIFLALLHATVRPSKKGSTNRISFCKLLNAISLLGFCQQVTRHGIALFSASVKGKNKSAKHDGKVSIALKIPHASHLYLS
jgi:hypothetical protein